MTHKETKGIRADQTDGHGATIEAPQIHDHGAHAGAAQSCDHCTLTARAAVSLRSGVCKPDRELSLNGDPH